MGCPEHARLLSAIGDPHSSGIEWKYLNESEWCRGFEV
jgi:hypothetical protein